jgi:hypothetical protein
MISTRSQFSRIDNAWLVTGCGNTRDALYVIEVLRYDQIALAAPNRLQVVLQLPIDAQPFLTHCSFGSRYDRARCLEFDAMLGCVLKD